MWAHPNLKRFAGPLDRESGEVERAYAQLVRPTDFSKIHASLLSFGLLVVCRPEYTLRVRASAHMRQMTAAEYVLQALTNRQRTDLR